MPLEHVQEEGTQPAQLGEPRPLTTRVRPADDREQQDQHRAGDHQHERRRRVESEHDHQDEHGTIAARRRAGWYEVRPGVDRVEPSGQHARQLAAPLGPGGRGRADQVAGQRPIEAPRLQAVRGALGHDLAAEHAAAARRGQPDEPGDQGRIVVGWAASTDDRGDDEAEQPRGGDDAAGPDDARTDGQPQRRRAAGTWARRRRSGVGARRARPASSADGRCRDGARRRLVAALVDRRLAPEEAVHAGRVEQHERHADDGDDERDRERVVGRRGVVTVRL